MGRLGSVKMQEEPVCDIRSEPEAPERQAQPDAQTDDNIRGTQWGSGGIINSQQLFQKLCSRVKHREDD